MSHHMSNPDDESMEYIRKMFKLGATNQFPDGKIADRDQGEVKLAIAAAPNKVLLSFGTPVVWVGFTPEQATSIGELLIEKAKEAKLGS